MNSIQMSCISVKRIGELSTPMLVAGCYTFCYTYPLQRKTRRMHVLSTPTALEIISWAARDYASIYQTRVPRTWGHDLADLVFEGFHIDEEKGTITFDIGS
jgi:hypothetical protein